MYRFFFSFLIIVSYIFINVKPIYAQSSSENPVYIIQSGDTLNIIALRFGVSVDDIIRANELENPNFLTAGNELIIPGLEGVSGVLTTASIPFGMNLKSISSQNQVPLPILIKLNHLTSPKEVFAGSNLVFPMKDQSQLVGTNSLSSGQPLFEFSIIHNKNPWSLVDQNQLSGTWDSNPGNPVYYLSEDSSQPKNTGNLFSNATLSPLPMVQGSTVVITISTPDTIELTGTLLDHDLAFFKTAENTYTALQGIYALAKPGLTPLTLQAKKDNGESFSFEQMVPVVLGGYAQESLVVDPVTIDPAVTQPEDAQVKTIITPVTPEKYWTEIFKAPVDEPCIGSWYGTRRSYNGGPFNYFHTGLDYRVCAPNLNIYAPAPGKVVFTGQMTVRGNATFIDHGQGVYTAIYHQSEISVHVGDMVETGQLIGQIGNTGRVTGPHLHWEIWVNGVQVDPLNWLENLYP
jgi:murein DD-endopeptidase MepM/ murein hydrolase activator NlpD